MTAKYDPEGCIELFDSEIEKLMETPPVSAKPDPPLPTQLTEGDWQDDPVPVKWNKIRASFFNAKTAAQIAAAAERMEGPEWLAWVVKMAPRDVRVTGDISFKHLVAEFGPIDREKYRPTPKAIPAEFTEVLD